MSNIVYQQFPVTSSAVDQLLPMSSGVDSSTSNTSLGFGSNSPALQKLPVSDQQLAGFGFSGAPGVQSVLPSGQFRTDSSSRESRQFLLPNQQVRETEALPNSATVMQSSILTKRKNPMEPLSIHGAPQELLMSNKRFVQMGHRSPVQEAATPNNRSAQMQSKFNSPKAQGLPAENKRGVHCEPRSGKSGLHQSSAARNQVKVQPRLKGQFDTNESVRSKMRDSLAGALSLVSSTLDKPTSAGQGSQGDAIASSMQSEDAQAANSFPVTGGAGGIVSGKPEISTSGEDVTVQDVNTSQILNSSSCSGKEYELAKMSVEDVSFAENLFVKDELLQGNGLSWVLDSYPEAAEKEIRSSDNQSFDQEERSRRNENFQSPESLAFKIELELYKLYGGVNKKYKEKGRSLLFNLKDRSNPELRERVMSGDIPPDRLCSMTAEELASKELSQWRIAKAEELAQMVVLPDTEVGVRRLVKKTHKGEYQVEMDHDGGYAEDIPLKTSSVTPTQSKYKKAASFATKSEESRDEGEVSKSENQEELCTLTIPPNEESDLMQGLMVDDVMKGTGNLPSIVSLDEFMQSLDSEPPFENLSANTVTTTPISDRDYSDRSDYKAANTSPRGPESIERKPVAGASEKSKLDTSEQVYNSNRNLSSIHALSKDRSLVPMGERIWEGLVQLNIGASSSIIGIFKCGEKTSTKEWSNLLEVKGRVRVDAFDKFLQELPMSRTRAVMAVNFVCSEGATESERVILQEAVDSYIMDERVGFAEPAPGIELYLCPPHKKTLEMLDKILSKVHIQELNMIDNGLIGIVVWRKLTSTVSPNSSHSNGSKREQFSRREQERDTKMDVKLTPTSKISTSMEQLHSIPKPLPNDNDDDVDLPPGFGPPAAQDDDLPEFDFSSSTGQQQLYSNRIPSQGFKTASAHLHQLPPSERMRELVHRYGQTSSALPSGAWKVKGAISGATKPWNDDDDDDIPEWQPQLPPQQPMLRPHIASYQSVSMAMPTPTMQSQQPIQSSLMSRGSQNVHQSLTQSSWGVHPPVPHGVGRGAGQFYGAQQQSLRNPGNRWRRDAPNRGF